MPKWEECVCAWTDASCQLLIAHMNIYDDDFKETWGWYTKFRHCQCLKDVSFYCE